jgi:hypothetical protein
MRNADTDDQLHAHLIALGLTRRAAGAIGADLHDLAEGIADIEAKLTEMDTVSPEAVREARFEIELHLRPHLTSLNAELRLLQRRKSRAR